MTGRRRHRREESGVALLVVLLTITLLTIVVVEFTYSAQVETHFALSSRNALQAYYLARSGVNAAEAILLVDEKAMQPDSDQALWAQPLPPMPVGDGTVAWRIRDEGQALNINGMLSGGLVQRDRYDVFGRLFDMLGIDRRVLAAIADWIDADHEPRTDPEGAEQPYYLGLTPPVEIRDGPLLTLRELLNVRGVTPSVLARLEGFVTVLRPQDGIAVNVNTAHPEVLMALSEELRAQPAIVDRLIATRREQPFTSPSEYKGVSGLEPALGANKDFLKIGKSTYFRIEAVGTVNDVARGIVTLVRRESGKVKRVTWAPSLSTLTLTSQPPSDFLQTLSPPGTS